MNRSVYPYAAVLALVAASGLGCSQATVRGVPVVQPVAHRLVPAGLPTPTAYPPLVQMPARGTDGAGAGLTATVCAHLPTWQRLDSDEQLKQLAALDRYGSAIYDPPLQGLAYTWWQHQAFSFTTYGLSARIDPLYLSGVWTAAEELWSCYEGDQPVAMNTGKLAEVWLIDHRFLHLNWRQGGYEMVVEPAAGLQVVQFERQPDDSSTAGLPLTVVTPSGSTVDVMVGDSSP